MSQTLTYVIGQDRRSHVDNVQDFKVNFDGSNTNWVQARQYERSMRQVFVNIKNEDGTPLDLTGCNVWFEGLLPKNSAGDFRIIDDKGYVALDPTAGRFRFDMPGHAFTVAGSYRQAFFRIVKDGNSITTLEFDLDVLADKVIDGLVPRTYISPVEELIDEIETKYQDSTDKLTKMASDFVDQFTQSMNTLKALGATVQNGLDALEQKIKQDGLFTQAEADTFKQEINQALGDLSDYKEPGTSFADKLIAEADDRGINVRHFGVTADGKTDDSQAIQNAVYKAVDLYPRVNTVIMPGGIYKIDHTLIVPPYIKMRSTGLVTFVSSSPQPVAWVKWLGEQDPDIVGKSSGNPYYNSDWQRGAIFGGQGGFSFISTLDKADGIGLELGFDNKDDSARNGSSAKSVSRYTLGDISISGFKVGLKLNATDLYIAKHSNLHIENNETGILFATGGSINSGESITFDNCTIAHCQQAFDCQYNSADFSLINCSLDFNDLVFKTYERPDFNISVINGNIEGNKRIIDCSASTSAEFKPTLSINGSVVYVRNEQLTNPDTAQFKGPLTLNVTNAYLIAHNNINGISYLCDSNVIVDRQGSLRTGRRDGKRYLLAERFNRFVHGHDLQLSVLANGKSDNGKVELRTKDNGLSKGMQDTLLPSALVYEHKASDGSNWDKLTFSQHIDVSHSSSYALSTWILFANADDTFDFKVKFYTNDDYLVRTDDIYFYDAKPSDTPQFLRAFPKDVPYYCDYAVVEATVVAKNVGDKIEIGYVGFEC